MTRLMAVGCLLAVLLPAHAQAQQAANADDAKILIGPLGLTPRLTVRQVGLDTNVLRSTSTPRRDFTATIEPQLDEFLRLGNAQFYGQSVVDWVYFARTTRERSMGAGQSGGVEVRLSRFSPFAEASYLRTEKFASLGLDARLPQINTARAAGVKAHLGPIVTLSIEGRQTGFALERVNQSSATFADSLDRSATSTLVTFRYTATPLTTFVVKAGRQQDRFKVSALRDSNSVTVSPGVEFKPFALASGSAFVGYRRFDALNSQVPDFAGPTAAVNLTYVARELTKIAVGFRRDIDYSYETTQPYFVAMGGDVTVTQMLGTGWDVVARAGRSRLDYRNVAGATTAIGRRDQLTTVGVGAGRHLSNGIRVGFDVDRVRRTSDIGLRGFEGYRFGGSVTYGS